jgi:hypothetical protein
MAADCVHLIADTDRGLGGRVPADLAWAKLHTLAEGTRLALNSLWPWLYWNRLTQHVKLGLSRPRVCCASLDLRN